MNEIYIYDQTDALIHAVANEICAIAKESIAQRGRFNFVLSGGSSPKKLFQLLASETYNQKWDWKKTYFFFGDERFVPTHSPQSNAQMAQEALFDPLGIDPAHIFRVDTSGSPEDAAQKYAHALNKHFKQEAIQFDYILLGLGDNAHTASLFPDNPLLDEKTPTVRSTFIKEVHMYRITMTAPLINQARYIVFLVFGANKAEAVAQILDPSLTEIAPYPAKLIRAKKGQLKWYMDEAAFAKAKNLNDQNLLKDYKICFQK